MKMQMDGVILVGVSVRLEYGGHHWDFFSDGQPNVMLVTPEVILAYLRSKRENLKAIRNREHAQLVVACIENVEVRIVEHFARQVLSRHDDIQAASTEALDCFLMIRAAADQRLSQVVA